MHDLKIADDLMLPVDTVTQAVGILAKRRAGKSYLARRLAEQLHAAGQQIVIVDPKGDWFGIRSAADGKSPGMPVVILGGDHGDLSLETDSGSVVAKLVVEERVSVLLDLSLLRKHEVATFMAVFLEDLYRLKARAEYRTPLMLFVDEADAIAPQKPQPNEMRMLGAINDVVRRGGQRGLGCCVITQRSAVLSKDVLTQVQVLITLRTMSPQDLAAIKAWIDVHGTVEQQKVLMTSLPSLPIGDAWFWSPGWPTDAGIFQRSHVLPITTFDSGATPKAGETMTAPKRLADVDLEAVRRQMAATIEKAKEGDPKMLHARIAELEKALAKDGKLAPVEPAEVPVFDEELFGVIREEAEKARDCSRHTAVCTQKSVEQIERVLKELDFYGASMRELLKNFAPKKIALPEKLRVKHEERVASSVATRSSLPIGEAKVLAAVFQYGDRSAPFSAISLMTGYASRSITNYVGRLVAAGLVERIGHSLLITDAGRQQVPAGTKSFPRGKALIEHLVRTLPDGESKVLAEVLSGHPLPVSIQAIQAETKYAPRSITNYVGRLCSRRAIMRVGRGTLKIHHEVFT